jgi:predicted ATPase/DNA-binding NarL/FixJ family response regulator
VPAEATSFVGRRSELAEVRKKLATARLVSLVGPGGVGKTRLAIRIATDLARGFPGGAWMVELAELRDPALVGNAVLAALDLRDQGGTEPIALLRSYLSDKELLLVVDNCEHLLEAAAQLVSDVMKAAPGVRFVVTSREPLSVAGEHVVPVPPLQLPAAKTTESLTQLGQNETVRLFVERAAAASGKFELTAANRDVVIEICRRLDGLPLAIELAAVRTRALSPEQIRDRLGARFDLLTGGSRAALARHQTLRTTIEWSYDLLAPAKRTLLSRLCVFAGRFTLEDVEAVCGFNPVPATGMLDQLASLLDKSLVVKEETGTTACYRLHETMREFASIRLAAAGERAAVERRCADHYQARCQRFAVEGRYRLLDGLAWMELEVDNVRAVLRRSIDQRDYGRAIDIATGLIWFWITRSTTEGVRWLDQLLPLDPDPKAHPWAYFVRGFLAVLQSDPASAAPALELGVTAARAAGQPGALSQTLAMASIAARMAGDQAESKRLLDEARDVAAGLDDLGATLMLHQARALNGLVDGELDGVAEAAAEGVRLSREAGDLYSLDMMLMNQGYAALRSGRVEDSEKLFVEALRIARQLDDRVAQCYLLGALGCHAAASRDQRLAAKLLGAMESLRAEIGASVNAGIAPAITQAEASARGVLGAPTYDADFQAGQQLGRQAAVRLALREAPSQPIAADPGGGLLGQREVAVARLVAEGLSNKEIGARLFISERTVESHVRNVLNKLGFHSRAQIATWMATPGP